MQITLQDFISYFPYVPVTTSVKEYVHFKEQGLYVKKQGFQSMADWKEAMHLI